MGPHRRHRRRTTGGRIVAGLVVGGLLMSAPLAGAGPVVDSAGRRVEVPDTVTRVLAAGTPAAVLVYTLRPEVLVGWPRAITEEGRAYLTAAARRLPETGRLTSRGGGASLERLLALEPDVILDFGSVRDTYADLADRVQAQTGIPYVLVDGRLDETATALRLVGELLGVPERGDALAREVEATLTRVAGAVDSADADARPRVYLARGPDGLETGATGSINTEIIERAGGVNVVEATGQRGLVQMSPEQLVLADPDTIVTWDRAFFESVWDDPLWTDLAAVRQGRVYFTPTAPFGWIDRPPSVNRVMGLTWLTGLFHPRQETTDLREATRRFYRRWYHVDLSDRALDDLLRGARGRPR